jgi:hypothetical protein
MGLQGKKNEMITREQRKEKNKSSHTLKKKKTMRNK